MGAPPHHGILPDTRIRSLIAEGAISASPTIEERQIQPASLDLRLGDKACRLRSSFHPERLEIKDRLSIVNVYESDHLFMYEIDLTQGGILEKGHVYVVPLLEHLALPKDVRGRANPKSSTGRLDIFTRMITDHNVGFDEVRAGYTGPLYLEIVPLSFTIKVRTGLTLNQLRLIKVKGKSKRRHTVSDTDLRKLQSRETLLYDNSEDNAPLPPGEIRIENGMFLRIDLRGKNDDPKPIVGYKAKKNSAVVDLSKTAYYAAHDFWEPIYRHTNDSLILDPQEFYILASKERIKVSAGYATEMVAYEAACGELRTHYAGFFDPGFGAGDGTRKGTQVVLEVRPHDVPFMIHDGQTFFKVVYETMLEAPERLYGEGIGSSYHHQGLTLSKHFKW